MNGRSGAGVWLVLAGCAVLIIGAMAWLTRSVMASEAERSLAESRAALEEKIRLSLWRMDSVAAALTIEENQRVVSPTELPPPPNPFVKLRFKLGPDGRALAVGDENPGVLSELNGLLASDEEMGSRFQMLCTAMVTDNQWGANNEVSAKNPDPEQPRQSFAYQQEMNLKEREARGKAINNAVSKAVYGQMAEQVQAKEPQPILALEASSGAFQPTWIADQPFLLRQVRVGGVLTAIEGVWIHRDVFRESLLGEVSDLLPGARLEPSKPGEGAAMDLASFPWRLIPGETASVDAALRGPVTASLAAGWLAVSIALLAGLVLVRGVVKLSERRASFVSAVTHELRTPLTTFRLYSDMLASGAVGDESKRTGYFRTMRREADRLSHLVENVLAFSRIERKGNGTRASRLEVADLMESMRERFEERLAGAGLGLDVKIEGEPVARGDAAGVEHVLFNLIDNAAKYAAGSEPPTVTLRASRRGGRVEIEVADHGPGIPESERRRIFRAFHKSAAEAADSKPGVGLGLALSRRIARDMGGGLECRGGKGARFVLVLPTCC